jgi:hypothetical protein
MPAVYQTASEDPNDEIQVMKNTIRVRRDGGKKPASVQTKTGSIKPAPQNNSLAVRDAIDLLREAKAASAAMHMLLADVLSTKESGLYCEETQLGITVLVCTTHERMNRAVDSVEALLESKTEVAS